MSETSLLITRSSTQYQFLPSAALVLDADTYSILESNPIMEHLAQAEFGSLLGRVVTEILPDLVPGEWQFLQANPSEGGTAFRTHMTTLRGNTIPVWMTISKPFDSEDRPVRILELRNAALEQDMEDRLLAKRWALRAYAAAAMALVQAESSETLLQDICDAITQDSPFLLAYVGIVGPAPDFVVHTHGKAGSAVGYLDDIAISGSKHLPSGQGPFGIAFRTRKSLVVSDACADPVFASWRQRAQQFRIQSLMAIPFPTGKEEFGVLVVYSSNKNAFGTVVGDAFEHLAQEIGVGLQSLRHREQAERERKEREVVQQQFVDALTAAVGAIAGALEAGDKYTAGHQRRVSGLAVEIGRAMGWSEDELQGLEMAAMVHDIGKLAVSQEILTKPGRLTEEEFALVKEHPTVAYQILKDIPFPWPVAGMAWQHHERLDGSGYPLGLKGEAILPGARILAVADIVESMACERPYRKALGVDVALQEVESLAAQGKLDAEVVKTCVRLFQEQRYRLPDGLEH